MEFWNDHETPLIPLGLGLGLLAKAVLCKEAWLLELAAELLLGAFLLLLLAYCVFRTESVSQLVVDPVWRFAWTTCHLLAAEALRILGSILLKVGKGQICKLASIPPCGKAVTGVVFSSTSVSRWPMHCCCCCECCWRSLSARRSLCWPGGCG